VTTEDEFQVLLDANPEDFHTRLVFADWLQERGDPRAEGYRALGVNGKTCCSAGFYTAWYCQRHYGWECRCLPDDWFDAIEHDSPGGNRGMDSFVWENRKLGEDAAALAFSKLPPGRRAELLSTGETP
jgi:uncharacterized protein (TIGR02996 family)